jgi:sensor histidine kinase YesM
LGQRLRVEWQIDAATLGVPIPPLTLQPLVENSILHGIAPQVAGGVVRIEARRPEPSGLALRVSDDGVGCVWPPAAASSRGIGLRSLQRRFELDYDGRARFDVRSAPGAGFRVEILIPHTEAG